MLTPEEIQSREFLVSLRGYDRDEVHAFLDEVAENFAQLLAETGGTPSEDGDDAVTATDEAATAPAEAPAPTPAPSPFAAIGAETQRILDAAQSAGQEIVARAEAEATRAREEALTAAEAEMAELRDQAAATQRQIDVLQLRRDEISDRLRQARETAELALMELEDDEAPSDAAMDTAVGVGDGESPDAAADIGTSADSYDLGDGGADVDAHGEQVTDIDADREDADGLEDLEK